MPKQLEFLPHIITVEEIVLFLFYKNKLLFIQKPPGGSTTQVVITAYSTSQEQTFILINLWWKKVITWIPKRPNYVNQERVILMRLIAKGWGWAKIDRTSVKYNGSMTQAQWVLKLAPTFPACQPFEDISISAFQTDLCVGSHFTDAKAPPLCFISYKPYDT